MHIKQKTFFSNGLAGAPPTLLHSVTIFSIQPCETSDAKHSNIFLLEPPCIGIESLILRVVVWYIAQGCLISTAWVNLTFGNNYLKPTTLGYYEIAVTTAAWPPPTPRKGSRPKWPNMWRRITSNRLLVFAEIYIVRLSQWMMFRKPSIPHDKQTFTFI